MAHKGGLTGKFKIPALEIVRVEGSSVASECISIIFYIIAAIQRAFFSFLLIMQSRKTLCCVYTNSSQSEPVCHKTDNTVVAIRTARQSLSPQRKALMPRCGGSAWRC